MQRAFAELAPSLALTGTNAVLILGETRSRLLGEDRVSLMSFPSALEHSRGHEPEGEGEDEDAATISKSEPIIPVSVARTLLVSPTDVDAIFGEEGAWSRFHAKYGAGGFWILSRVGFWTEHEAVLYVEYAAGPLAWTGVITRWRKAGTRWQIVDLEIAPGGA